MTPEVKAFQLTNKFYKEQAAADINRYDLAIASAIIFVEEIIYEYEDVVCSGSYHHDLEIWKERKAYWEQVKIEIDGL